MRTALAGIISTGALILATAAPAAAAPNAAACAHEPHGTERAHATVPHNTAGNHVAHMHIPHVCH